MYNFSSRLFCTDSGCEFILSNKNLFCVLYPLIKSILLSAIINGVLYCFKISIDSRVWGFNPSFISITKIAMSAKLPPRLLRLLKAACPGESIINIPGIFIF